MKTLSKRTNVSTTENRSFNYSVCPNCKSETLVKTFIKLGTRKQESCNCFMCGYEKASKRELIKQHN